MRQLAPAARFAVGDLVVIAAHEGVFRVESIVDVGGSVGFRCFSYKDGGFVVASDEEVSACPVGERAAP